MNKSSGSSGVLAALLRHAERDAARRAYTFLENGETESAVLTYGELEARSRHVAAQLLARGVARGEPVLLAYPPGLAFISSFLGCLRAGAVAVPVPMPRRNRDNASFLAIVHDTGARLVLTTTPHRERLETVVTAPGMWWMDAGEEDEFEDGRGDLPLPSADDLAVIQYTSGSTGDPKGVMISHGNLAHNEACIREAMGNTPESVGVGWLPHVHDMGLVGNILQSIVVGAHQILMPPAAMVQSPFAWLRAITRYRGTTCGGPNFAFDLCVEKVTPEQRAQLCLRSWKVAFVGAEPVRAATLERFAEAFAPSGFSPDAWLPCYGMAETTLMVTGARGVRTLTLDDGRKVVSCGPPVPDTAVVIRDTATGEPAAPGVVGEILVSGPSVSRGYWRRDELNAERFGLTMTGHDGRFLATGDLGLQNGDGLFVLGRLKEMVIVRGQNYYAEDLERTVQEAHASLQTGSAAVFGVQRDDEEAVVVVQEVRRGVGAADAAAAADAIAQAVWAEHEVAVSEVLLVAPGQVRRTTSGKVQRPANRAAYQDESFKVVVHLRPAASPQTAPGPERITREALLAADPATREASVLACLEAMIARLSREPAHTLDPQRNLMELGLDSMHLLEIKVKLDALAGSEIPLNAFLDAGSAAAIARIVADLCVHGTAGASAAGDAAPADASAAAEKLAPGPDAETLKATISRMSHSFPDYLVELTATHGDVVRLDLGGQIIHLIANPDELDTVMVRGYEEWLRRGVWAPFRTVMGHHGLITSEGSAWKNERRFANPRFGRQAVQHDIPAIARVVSRELAAWADAAEPVALLPAAKRLTLSIILDKLFGDAPTPDETQALYEVLHDLDRLWNVPAMFLYANQAGERQTRAYQERLAGRVAAIDRCVYAWVDRLLDAGPDAGGVIGSYVRAAREAAGGGRITEDVRQELRDVGVTYILTGFDTTASGIYWTVALLLEHPGALARLREEVAGKADVDLAALPYLKGVVQEALRLYPPVWYVGREATAATTLRGYVVPEGSFAITSPYVVHRNPALWPDPLAFKPERFLPNATPKPPVRAYMPFGLGGRICIGLHFALVEIATMVGVLVRDHELEQVGGEWRGLSSDFTLTPRAPIQMAVSRTASRAMALT